MALPRHQQTTIDHQNEALKLAVHRHDRGTKQGLLERTFTRAFRGLVYAQIWEDPIIDLEALVVTPDCHIVTIASGGCNVLSYLTANPRAITAVDLNTAHIAFNKLKVAAARHLPDYASFYRFFGTANDRANLAAYRAYVRPNIDETTRRYWEGRDLTGQRRIAGFANNIYKRGLLGRFIGTAHLLAKLYKVDLTALSTATSLEEQRAVFDEKLAPLFKKRFVRWLIDQPASLFGLGIPPAQYKVLASDDADGIHRVLHDRLEKLACGFEIKDNYFAAQAFGRAYGKGSDAARPPYLQAKHYAAVVNRVDRVDIRHINFVDFLAQSPDASLDRFVLLDAQDWMTDAQLNTLWRELTRVAKQGARVVFRTAASPSLLPGRVDDAILAQWDYREAESRDYTARDRAAIYGGVHLYVLKSHA